MYQVTLHITFDLVCVKCLYNAAEQTNDPKVERDDVVDQLLTVVI